MVWEKTAENCAQYLQKGRSVYVEGRLQTRDWEDREGNKRQSTEIVATNVTFLGGREDGARSGASTPQQAAPAPEPAGGDDIPF